MSSLSDRADRRLSGGVEARGILWLDIAIQEVWVGCKAKEKSVTVCLYLSCTIMILSVARRLLFYI
jgi:hypothetical protein